jgi:hypothetical protein
MSPVKKESTARAAPDDHSPQERVADALESINSAIQDLCEEIHRLHDEVSWALSNDRFHSPPPAWQVTSMPVDPVAADFGERLNELTPADLPPEEPSDRPSPATSPPARSSLFDADA